MSTPTDREITTFAEAVRDDPAVNQMFQAGLPAEHMVVHLVNQKNALMKLIMELQSIAPQRVVTPDGRHLVWHCPDDLVPFTKLRLLDK